MGNLARVVWRKITRSGSNGCVEVEVRDGHVAVRNSKHRHGPELTFTLAEWEAFLREVIDRTPGPGPTGTHLPYGNDDAGRYPGYFATNTNLSSGLAKYIKALPWVNKAIMTAVLATGTYQANTSLLSIGCFLAALDHISMHMMARRLISHERQLHELRTLGGELTRFYALLLSILPNRRGKRSA
jgi:Domain of unknown function (DUF397)